jgi:hypothetical protein
MTKSLSGDRRSAARRLLRWPAIAITVLPVVVGGFTAARATAQPKTPPQLAYVWPIPLDPEVEGNGCGSAGGPKFTDNFGDFSFLSACNHHDQCYGTAGNAKGLCDLWFATEMIANCRLVNGHPALFTACADLASDYYNAVSLLPQAKEAYKNAQYEANVRILNSCGC